MGRFRVASKCCKGPLGALLSDFWPTGPEVECEGLGCSGVHGAGYHLGHSCCV